MSTTALTKASSQTAQELVRPLSLARLFFLLNAVLGIASLPRLFENGKQSGLYGGYSPQWILILTAACLLVLAEMGTLVLLNTRVADRLAAGMHSLLARISNLKALCLLGFVAVWALYVAVVLYRLPHIFKDFLAQAWLFWLIAGIGAVFLMGFSRHLSFFHALIASAILYGFGMRILFYLPELSHFPFSIGWSEGSRYYYGSLPFSSTLYGERIPLSPWHPSRYLLLSLPFTIPDSSLFFSRLWQVVLWLVTSMAAGLALSRRFQLKPPVLMVGTLWCALVLLQGPVYYHLLVSVIIMLWGFDRRRFWKTLLVVALSSVWAGISRVNWVPVPAGLAAALYLIETSVSETGGLHGLRGWLAYFRRPVVWGVIGCGVALAAQSVYVLASGQSESSMFGSSFTSALLWYRLLPNPTNALGVLPSALLVTAPQLILIGVNIVRKGRAWHPLRVKLLGLLTLVLFAGGLVVSTKIGGGSNLHNVDAYLVLVLVISMYVWMDRFAPEGEPGLLDRPLWRPWALTLLLVIIPVTWGLQVGKPFIRYDMDQAAIDLDKLNAEVQKRGVEGEVLFITQRQLQVFGMTPVTQPYPDYELLTLSEMAISNNQAYLSKFYDDLKNHRFALIVVGQPNQLIQDPMKDAFAEENNAWVTRVSRYLLEYYQSDLYLETQGIDLMVPR